MQFKISFILSARVFRVTLGTNVTGERVENNDVFYKFQFTIDCFLLFSQISMTVRPIRVKMAEHVQMELTALPFLVFWVILGTTVRQVKLTNKQ